LERTLLSFSFICVLNYILYNSTTFFSVIFSALNSLRLQGTYSSVRLQWLRCLRLYPESVARALSDYLTAETGVTVIFESAIVPKWKDSRISFKNVYISRRPSHSRARLKKTDEHAAAFGYDVSGHPAIHRYGEEEEDRSEDHNSEDDNYSQFDLNIDSIDVTLSLWRWLDGKGLVEDAVIRGVRGVLGTASLCPDVRHYI
jgi:mitochondrial distribution and morphology protein 31